MKWWQWVLAIAAWAWAVWFIVRGAGWANQRGNDFDDITRREHGLRVLEDMWNAEHKEES